MKARTLKPLHLLGVLVTLLMAVSLLSVGAVRAYATESYELWVGDTQVTDANKNDIPVAAGTARFDSGTNTLTLTNVTGVNGTQLGAQIYAGLEGSLTIDVTGGLTLSDATAEYGIYNYRSNLTIRGNVNIESSSCALYCDEGSITVNGGARLTAGTGLAATEDVTIAGNVSVEAFNGSGIISGDGSITLGSSGNTISVTSNDSAITATKNIVLNGNVVASSEKSSAVYSIVGSVTINGTADLAGTEVVRARNDVTITGNATVQATTGTGICSDTGAVTLGTSENTFSITSNNLGAVDALKNVTINGNVTATANKAIALRSQNGSVTVNGDAKLKGTSTVSAQGDVRITGNVNGEATTKAAISSSKGAVTLGTGGNAISLTSASASAVTAKNNVEINGNVTATSPNATALYSENDSVTIYGEADLLGTQGIVSDYNVYLTGIAHVQGTDGPAISANGNITLNGTMAITGNAPIGIVSKGGWIKLLDGRLDASGSQYALFAAGGIGFPANYGVTAPDGGVVSEVSAVLDPAYPAYEGYTVKDAAGNTIASSVVIEKVGSLPSAVAIDANVTGIEPSGKRYQVKVDNVDVRFEGGEAPIKATSASVLYTSSTLQSGEELTLPPVTGKPYYFSLSVKAFADGDDFPTLTWDDYSIKANSALTAANGKVEIVGLAHSPAGGEIALLCKYTMTGYVVTFNAGGGKGTMAAVTGVLGNYKLPTCTFVAPAGKRFKAWRVGSTEKAVGTTIIVTADTTLTAVWESASTSGDTVSGTWKQDSKGWWFALTGGGYAKNSWQVIGGKWYHFNGAGYMDTGWIKDGGSWYYLKSSGVMATGWLKDGGSWYYLTKSGAMQTGWVKDSSNWYYMNTSGVMQTGWIKDGGSWYYLNGAGVMQANKWIGDYYVTASGAMATNTWIGNYHVDASGRWDKSR